MKIQVSEALPLSADDAFHLIRDEMPNLVPYLYDIETIEVVERRDEGEVVHIVNRWKGDLSKVPGAARKFIKPELLTWKDTARWTTADRLASWKLEPSIGGRVFECVGTTQLLPDGETSRLEMKIELNIYPENVPGLPRFLAKTVRKQIEGVIAKQITPNLRNLAESIRRYVAAQ